MKEYLQCLVCMVAVVLQAAPARGQTVRAFDPALHVRPPLATYQDGTRELVFDAAFRARAAHFRGRHPAPVNAAGDVTRVGEVLVIEATPDMVETDGQRFSIASHQAIARRVIEAAGDVFHTITLWPTFVDASTDALAYALNVRNEVHGLGPTMPVRDLSAAYGSSGMLRTIVNMKEIGLRTAGETREAWREAFETWGQEAGHRFMMFLHVRVAGQRSDLLLGRDCAHYSRFVETQGSVHDGFAWTDNRNGTFTFSDFSRRYAYLDLYGMGLLPADELPPFFVILDVPGYVPPPCSEYSSVRAPTGRTVSGRRQEITIADIVAANGPRVPALDSGYVREALVVLTRLGESANSQNALALAQKIDRVRGFWEEWVRENSQRRQVVCTRTSADCGDPRSDVVAIDSNVNRGVPGRGAIAFDVRIANTGGAVTTGIMARMAVRVGEQEFSSGGFRVVGTGRLEPTQGITERFSLELPGVGCGSLAEVSAWTQSDFHYHRLRQTEVLGTEIQIDDDFEVERGWTVNPTGDDTTRGARWERGRPMASEIGGKKVQPGAARRGENAWVTGLRQDAFVYGGHTTLVSAPIDATNLVEPIVRYWVWFAGMRSDTVGSSVEPSPLSLLQVSARALPADSAGAADADAGTDWVPIDVLADTITEGWEHRTARLPASLYGATRLQLRFVAADMNPQAGGVEAAIDDVTVLSNLPGCVPKGGDGGGQPAVGAPIDAGCGCRVGGDHGAAGASAPLVFVTVFVLTLRVRRHLRRPGSKAQCVRRRHAWRWT